MLSKCVDGVGKIAYAGRGTSGNCVGFDPTQPGANTASANLRSFANRRRFTSKAMTSSSAHQQSTAMQSASQGEAPTPLSQIRSPRISYPRAHGQCPATAGFARLPDLRDVRLLSAVLRCPRRFSGTICWTISRIPAVLRCAELFDGTVRRSILCFPASGFYPSFPDRGGGWCGSGLSVIADQQCLGRLAVCGEAPDIPVCRSGQNRPEFATSPLRLHGPHPLPPLRLRSQHP